MYVLHLPLRLTLTLSCYTQVSLPFPLFASLAHSLSLHQMSAPSPNHSRQSRHSRHPPDFEGTQSLAGARLYFSRALHSNSYQTQTLTRSTTYLKLWKHVLTDKCPLSDNTMFTPAENHRGYACRACKHTHMDVKWRETLAQSLPPTLSQRTRLYQA